MSEAADRLRMAFESGDQLETRIAMDLAIVELARLEADNRRLEQNWLTEQKARLEQFNFLEQWEAAKCKHKIERLRAENEELRKFRDGLVGDYVKDGRVVYQRPRNNSHSS